MTLGLIARCDSGGLAAQTYEAYRHLQPYRTLVIDLGAGGRGNSMPHLYNQGDVIFSPGVPNRETMAKFLDGLTTVFTCESTYGYLLCDLAPYYGVRVVIQANPELRVPTEWTGAEIVLPTEWERRRFEKEKVLPVPINREVLPFKLRTEAKTFYHIAAPAMLDRNGTQIVIDALKYVSNECKVIIRGASSIVGFDRIGNVTVDYLPFETKPYYDLWPEEADIFLLPRRYGGLCLPMQEAASLGMPIVAIGAPPMDSLPHAFNVPATAAEPVQMKGGTFNVYSASPRKLAEQMDWLIEHRTYVSLLSTAADTWADKHSWDTLLPNYERLLGLSKRERKADVWMPKAEAR